jgi:hypothetical protein
MRVKNRILVLSRIFLLFSILTFVILAPAEAQQQKPVPCATPSVPESFRGTWVQSTEGTKLTIGKDKIVWVRKVFQEMREEIHSARDLKVSSDGRTISFSSKQVYAT